MLQCSGSSCRVKNLFVGFRCSYSGFQQCWNVVLVGALISLFAPSVEAQPIGAAPGFWGLRPGNQISVLVSSLRHTVISTDGQPEVTRETTDTLQILYRVVAIERSGDVIVKTTVRKMDRQPPASVLTRLSGAAFSLAIHSDGNVSTLTPEGRDALVTYLSGGDPESAQVLKKSLTDETIASWFSVPFWMIRPAEDDKNQDTWDRNHEVSLGTLGSLQLNLDFHLGAAKDSIADIEIIGDAHFRPLVLPEVDGTAFPFLSNVSVEIDEVSGIGRLYVAPSDGDSPPRQRPQFETVEWTTRLHGEAQLPPSKISKTPATGDSDDDKAAEQDVPRKTATIKFRQTQRQVWTLQSFSIGMPGMFENDRLSIPLQ